MWRHLLVCAAMASMAIARIERWESYKNSFGLSFEDEKEEARRMTIFLENVKAIEKHNIEANLGKHTYWQGVNQFTHMTDEEYRAIVIGNCLLDINATKTADVPVHQFDPKLIVPSEVNWVEEGYVTPVKNQGQCGSCYAFSATGALEGQWFKKTGKLVSLSEQQIVDCSASGSWFQNGGCYGGWYQWAWWHVYKAGGIESETDYPYKAVQANCSFDPGKVVVKVKSFQNLQGESELLQAVATVGPVSVAIDASRPGFRNYRSGVYYDYWCSTWNVDHAVLAVGYGTENGQDYWLVKNSWSTDWGAGGYIKMARNRGNSCGIASHPSYPIV